MKFKVAAAQIDFGTSAIQVRRTIRYYLQVAKRKGVEIVCFPECSLHEGPRKNILALKEIAAECKKQRIWCIVGGYLKERGKTYNSAVLINSAGRIVGKHKKVHLCDHYCISPGKNFKVFETPFCKIGVAICWDINNPETLHQMVKEGAKVIFCPMYWHYEDWSYDCWHKYYEKRLLESLLVVRAFENLSYVVFSNAYNEERKRLVPYSGIAEPQCIIKSIYDKPGMIIAEVDLNYLKRLRKKYAGKYRKIVSEF